MGGTTFTKWSKTMAADVQCPKCGAKHFIMYGDKFRCPCGNFGPVEPNRTDSKEDK